MIAITRLLMRRPLELHMTAPKRVAVVSLLSCLCLVQFSAFATDETSGGATITVASSDGVNGERKPVPLLHELGIPATHPNSHMSFVPGATRAGWRERHRLARVLRNEGVAA